MSIAGAFEVSNLYHLPLVLDALKKLRSYNLISGRHISKKDYEVVAYTRDTQAVDNLSIVQSCKPHNIVAITFIYLSSLSTPRMGNKLSKWSKRIIMLD